MIKSSVTNCPVPSEQQPINEYEALKTSWLYRDCTLNWRGYLGKMLWIYSISWLVAGPVAAASFPLHKYLGKFILGGCAGASIGLLLVLVRLYSGWFYVRNRLYDPVIFYEESGWYDGQTWTKPEDVLGRDRLIVSYQIQPVLRRLELTFAVLAGLYLAGIIIWQFL